MSKRILFFGNERLATGIGTTAPVFRALLQANYEIAALVVAQKATGPSRKPRPLEIVEVAEARGVPVIAPENPSIIQDQLRDYGAEAAVLAAYGKLVPQSVIDLFPRGIINIHPSLLPKHRGSAPIESVILNGESETGVSLMQLAGEMDAGPLYAQTACAVPSGVSKHDLTEKLLAEGGNLLTAHLPAILDGSLQPVPQDSDRATVDNRISKEDGILDWNKPAERLEREIRAYLGWPRSRAKIGGIDAIITRAHVLAGSGKPGTLYLADRQFGIHTANGILMVDSLMPAGKKEMSAAAFRAGYSLN